MGVNVTRELLHIAADEIQRQQQEIAVLRGQMAVVQVFEAALLGRRGGGMTATRSSLVDHIKLHLAEIAKAAVAAAEPAVAGQHSSSDAAGDVASGHQPAPETRDRRVPRNELRQGAQFQEGTL